MTASETIRLLAEVLRTAASEISPPDTRNWLRRDDADRVAIALESTADKIERITNEAYGEAFQMIVEERLREKES